jgi:hypothetical protein
MKEQRLRQLARESMMDSTTDGLIVFGTILDGFFNEVRKNMRKALGRVNSFFNEP